MTSYLMDHRLLHRRRKNIYEQKPDFLWDARYNVLDSGGARPADGGYVNTWAPIRGSSFTWIQAGTNATRPILLEEGIGETPALLFDGGRWLNFASCPVSTFTVHTIQIDYQPLGVNTGFYQTYLSAVNSASVATNRLYVGLRSTGVQFTYGNRNNATANGAASATDVNTGALPHSGIWTVNAAGNAWEQYLDGNLETLSPIEGGNNGWSYSSISSPNRMSVGAVTSNGTSVSYAAQVKISRIAMWGRRI